MNNIQFFFIFFFKYIQEIHASKFVCFTSGVPVDVLIIIDTSKMSSPSVHYQDMILTTLNVLHIIRHCHPDTRFALGLVPLATRKCLSVALPFTDDFTLLLEAIKNASINEGLLKEHFGMWDIFRVIVEGALDPFREFGWRRKIEISTTLPNSSLSTSQLIHTNSSISIREIQSTSDIAKTSQVILFLTSAPISELRVGEVCHMSLLDFSAFPSIVATAIRALRFRLIMVVPPEEASMFLKFMRSLIFIGTVIGANPGVILGLQLTDDLSQETYQVVEGLIMSGSELTETKTMLWSIIIATTCVILSIVVLSILSFYFYDRRRKTMLNSTGNKQNKN